MSSGEPDSPPATPDPNIQAVLDTAERQIEAALSLRRSEMVQTREEAERIAGEMKALAPLPTPEMERHRRRIHARCLSGIALCQERVSDYVEAIRLGHVALEEFRALRQEVPDPPDDAPATGEAAVLGRWLSETLRIVGNAYKNMGEYAEALRMYEEDQRLMAALHETIDEGHAFNNIGNVSYHLGDYARAVECYLAALERFDAHNWPRGKGSSFNGLGNVHYNQGDYARSLEGYEKALAIFEQMEDPYWIAGILGNAANACVRLGQRDRALAMHERSLRVRREIGDRQGQGHSFYNLGEFYAAEGNAPAALRAYRRAIRIFDRIEDKNGLAGANVALGRLLSACRKDRLALLHLNGGLFFAEQAGMRDIVYSAHEALSEVYERQGDLARALEHYRRFHTVKETIFNEASDRRVRNLQVLHESEQARREAEIYRRHNAELEAANAALREADAFKTEVMARLRRQSEALEKQARTDSLTGLLNRRAAGKRLNEEFARAKRQGQPLSVVVCDIDHFKSINDTFSHQIGDRVLRTVARLLRRSLRRTDAVGRYGGEEFVLVMPGTILPDAVAVCEQLCERVAAHPWTETQPGLAVTVSMGVCSLAAAPEAQDYEHLLRVADDYLYQAKNSGRNRVCYPAFPPSESPKSAPSRR
jgi:diguanylate cyclase (GGDEF) domain